MSSSLLKTKLYIPPVRPELVSRPRLVERLNAGLGRKLTLVSAPAGFGKTTLLSEWVTHAERLEPHVRFTWFSLDKGDNDPIRFWLYFIGALQAVEESIGESALSLLQSPSPAPTEAVLTALINDITALSHPLVLILDDYHLIHSPPIHQHLTFLLEHQPPQMHVAVATREDPPLSLSRLRARGHMVEIRQDDLRFTEQEATDFLWRVTQRELSSTDINALRQRTEGWIAGLQLTALSLRGHDDVHQFVESFAGSHRYILDYLMEEVFQQQPADVQDFLLKTSILDRFTASLCDAVCSVGTDGAWRDDSHHLLLALEQTNLFIIPLDESRQWYRYHHLFADLLRQQLRAAGTQNLVPLLHNRASRWYEAEGFRADAIQHALVGSDWERAASLLNDVGEAMLKRGEVVTLLGWFRTLPDEVVHADPELCNLYSWPLILTEQIDAAESYLTRAEQIVQEQRGEDAPFLGGTAVARVHIARARGDVPRAIELSERALTLLPRDDLSARSIVAMNLGIAQWHSGRLVEAKEALVETQRAAAGSGNDYVRCTALLFLSRIQQARGKLHQAAAAHRQLIRQGERIPIAALAHYDLGKLLYEWNDLSSAAEHLRQGIKVSRDSGNKQYLAEGCSALALVRQVQGESSAAQAALEEARQLSQRPDVSLDNLGEQILLALAQGDLRAASSAAEQSPTLEDAGSFPDSLRLLLTNARLLLAQEQKAAAADLLATLWGMASQAGWQSVVTQTRVLQALAAPTPDEALVLLRKALTLAEPEGYVRTFVDLGEPMAKLLRQVASQGIAPEYVGKLLAAIGVEKQRIRGVEMIESPPAPLPSHPPASLLIEPLSDRELQALRLLADGHTNQEMANELCVSINTVKAHLKNIYSKLGVHKRRQAVATARELDLLP
ncbi:MAG: AAA family ATPase [Chloroflexi bacterium]|nr:AAA family ATPase [Chloroflexota bacterium]